MHMATPATWIPFRWPDSWTDPALLTLASEAGINCLLASGKAPSAPGFDIVDWTQPSRSGITLAEAGEKLWTAKTPILALDNAAWPGVKTARKDDAAEAGPTGVPWIDSSAWALTLGRALAPEAAIWVCAAPPGQDRADTADVRTGGGRRGPARRALGGASRRRAGGGRRRRQFRGAKTWDRIAAAVRFASKHLVGPSFETEAPVGVVSTFTGDNEFLAGEILNLASRRSLLCRAITADRARAAAFAGLAVVLYADPEPAPAALAQALRDFALQGGLVVTPAKSAPRGEAKTIESPVPGYVLKAFGKGRVAYPEPEWEDPFLIAAAVHNLASRRVDPLRVFNTSTALFNYGHAGGAKRPVAHMVNYSGRAPANPVTLAVQRKTATATFYTLESAAGTALPGGAAQVRSGVPAAGVSGVGRGGDGGLKYADA